MVKPIGRLRILLDWGRPGEERWQLSRAIAHGMIRDSDYLLSRAYQSLYDMCLPDLARFAQRAELGAAVNSWVM